MKKTSILLAAFVICQSVSYSQISIKAPKFGKSKEEKKTEANTTTETTVKQNETVKPQENGKKVESGYYFTNYAASLSNGKNYTIKNLDVYRNDNEWVSMHMKLEAEDGSKLDESYFEHYKDKDKSYYERKQSFSYVFPMADGSYLLTNKNASVANLFSSNKELINKAPAKEELLKTAKDLVSKIKEDELKKEIVKNDEDFKKVNQVSKNASLETQFKAALTKSDANLAPEFKNVYKRIVLNSADWFVVNNALGQPLRKVFNITYIYTDSKNQCYYGFGSVMKEHLGGGKYSDVVKFNAGIPFADGSFKKIISCELVK